MAKPRLRFDKVARRFTSDLEAALRDEVPAGKAVIVTITAPIWQASKTGVALEVHIRKLLKSRATLAELEQSINGNGIRVRIVSVRADRTQKVFGFVHNPDPGAAETLIETATKDLA